MDPPLDEEMRSGEDQAPAEPGLPTEVMRTILEHQDDADPRRYIEGLQEAFRCLGAGVLLLLGRIGRWHT